MQRTFTALFAVAGLLATVVLAADRPATVPLRTQPLDGIPNKVADMLTVEYAPGQSSPPHRHNANVLVYVLEGALVMGVKGKEPVTVSAGKPEVPALSDLPERPAVSPALIAPETAASPLSHPHPSSDAETLRTRR